MQSENEVNVFVDYSTPNEYFNQRFSLYVLDIIRRLQKTPTYENGVEKCHIMSALENQTFIDGDLSAQVSTALIGLESCGLIMNTCGGFKTLGPFAKLCLAKNSKQRRLAWEKLEENITGLMSTPDFVPNTKRLKR